MKCGSEFDFKRSLTKLIDPLFTLVRSFYGHFRLNPSFWPEILNFKINLNDLFINNPKRCCLQRRNGFCCCFSIAFKGFSLFCLFFFVLSSGFIFSLAMPNSHIRAARQGLPYEGRQAPRHSQVASGHSYPTQSDMAKFHSRHTTFYVLLTHFVVQSFARAAVQ